MSEWGMDVDMTDHALRGFALATYLVSQIHPYNFALAVRVRGALTPDRIRQALDQVRQCYPDTSARVTGAGDGAPRMACDDSLAYPLATMPRTHANAWEAALISNASQPFDLSQSPPIRVVWMRGDTVSDLIFVFHHAFADGLAAVSLVRDFLTFLGDPGAGIDSAPPAPPLRDLLPDFAGKRGVVLGAQLKAALFRTFVVRGRQAAPLVDSGAAGRVWRVQPWTLSPEQTTALVTRCRAEGTTVHAALVTAFLRAFGAVRGGGWKRKVQSPVSVRDRLREPVGKAFGFYIGMVTFKANFAPERDFWDVARDVKKEFIRRAGDRPLLGALADQVVVLDELAAVLTPADVARSFERVDYDLSITNLGRLEFPLHYGALTVEALHGPAVLARPDEVVLGVLTVGGQLTFTLTFAEAHLPLAEAETIKEDAMARLAAATGAI
ncbi:MAG: hypothetical protein JXB35_10155 [Anaerolineae bacterium]|nr:hypothetical protein [Anaerolineae bacterium]